ncbi:hypothetical protein [Flavobacterium xanthum]|uniref:Uncharacterized protein n=1 Tax=Flavobacterium xanthum TaxID=69322 RepID=A0A1M7B8L3_9FLAO|nr:hypothetical protein [Flavobacterium xanthum]SHL51355.1 hypothetical protein SAMN05443669_1008104 [Flavobacterium xanthum]
MKKSILLCLLVIIYASCQKKHNDVFYDILDDNFLVLSDTIAYDHNSFFITPNDSIKTNSTRSKDYKICIEKKIIDSREYVPGILKELEGTTYTKYLKLLEKHPYSKLKLIDLKKLKSIGKFKLIALSNPKINKDFESKYIGIIRFYKPFINEKYAILIYSKQSSQKDGVVNACLFKKEEGHWKLEKKIELERW